MRILYGRGTAPKSRPLQDNEQEGRPSQQQPHQMAATVPWHLPNRLIWKKNTLQGVEVLKEVGFYRDLAWGLLIP